MATAAAKQFGALRDGLNPQLLRFFKRYPPVLSSTSNETTTPANSPALLPYQGPNPFLPHKFEPTGRWHNPKFSLRRQADLMKLAEDVGLEEIMPASIKSHARRSEKRQEGGLKVKGTGVGQRVKGHWWERTLYERLEKRRQAMLEMPNLIYKWKKLGHGKGWKKWPK